MRTRRQWLCLLIMAIAMQLAIGISSSVSSARAIALSNDGSIDQAVSAVALNRTPVFEQNKQPTFGKNSASNKSHAQASAYYFQPITCEELASHYEGSNRQPRRRLWLLHRALLI